MAYLINNMKFFSDKPIFFAAISLSLLCFGLAFYLAWQRYSMEDLLNQHQFDRGFLISESEVHTGRLSGSDTTELMNAQPNVKDGAAAILSRATLLKLQAMPEIDSLMAITSVDQTLKLSNGKTSAVKTYYMPPKFIEIFHVGDPALLQRNVYIPSLNLQKELGELNSKDLQAHLGLGGDMAKLISENFKEINLAQYRVPIQLSSVAYDMPGGSKAFANALFSTGEPAQFNIPNIVAFHKIWLLVKIRDGVDRIDALQKLTDLVENGSSAMGNKKLQLQIMSDFFAEQLSMQYLKNWTRHLQLGVYAVATTTLLMLALSLFPRLRHETALRYCLGTARSSSAWFAIRSPLFAIVMGIAFGSCVAVLACATVKYELLQSLMPMVFAMLALILLSAMILFGTSLLAARGQLIQQLKGA